MQNLESEISKAICELNTYRTPPSFKVRIGRILTPTEIELCLHVLETFVPYETWRKEWRAQRALSEKPEACVQTENEIKRLQGTGNEEN